MKYNRKNNKILKQMSVLIFGLSLVVINSAYSPMKNDRINDNVVYSPTSDWKAPLSADKLKNPFTDDVEARFKGKKLFNKKCWTCHGKTGKGDGPNATNFEVKLLSLSVAKFQNQTDGAIFWKISNGRGKMPKYENSISKDERWMIVNYLRTFKK